MNYTKLEKFGQIAQRIAEVIWIACDYNFYWKMVIANVKHNNEKLYDDLVMIQESKWWLNFEANYNDVWG